MRWSFDLYPYVVRFGNIGPELMKSVKNVFNKYLVLASKKDQEKFFSTVFRNPKPNQKLIDAAKRYKLREMIREKGELGE